jgi:hypothetical protein
MAARVAAANRIAREERLSRDGREGIIGIAY